MEEKNNVTLAVLARDVQHLAKNSSELKADLKAGFDAVDKRHSELRADMKAGFDAVDKRHSEIRADMKAGFDAVDKRIHWLLGAMGTITALLLTTFGAGFLFLINRQDAMAERLGSSIEHLAAEVRAQREPPPEKVAAQP